MTKLAYGADIWIDQGIDMIQVGNNEWEWGFIDSNFDHYSFAFTAETKLGGGFFKSETTARKRMMWELMSNERLKARANKIHWDSVNFQKGS